MPRLVTFGCSNTYGIGLPDCFSEERCDMPPSKLAWPQLLADKMNLECVNLSRGGSSNKRIHHAILNAELRSDDIVIVNWSFLDRWCIIREHSIDDLVHYMAHWNKIKYRFLKKDRPDPRVSKMASSFFGEVHDEHDMNLDLNYRMHHVYLYLSSKDITQYQLVIHDKFIKASYNNTPYIEDLAFNTFSKKYSRALDNTHPGPDAHLAYADELYRILNNT